MASTVPHLMLDEDGCDLCTAHFAPAVFWQPGDTIIMGARDRYRVLERRDGDPVVLVVERTKTETP